jgi:LysM repeat protein
MMRRMAPLLAIGLLQAAGCSDKNSDKVQVTVADARGEASLLPSGGVLVRDESDAATARVEEEIPPEKLAAQARQERFIIARPGETIRLYQDWSGIPVEELKLINQDKLPGFGQKYVLSLTASEFSDFERKREEYWGERKKEIYDKNDVRPVEYTVKKNDTLDGISRRFEIPLWFLVMHNQASDPYRLSPGAVLVIPTLSPRAMAEAKQAADDQIPEADAKDVFPVIVKSGETVGLYAKWGQISVEDIKRVNRHIPSFDKIRVGDTVNMPLTAKQFKRFQEIRKQYGAPAPAAKKEGAKKADKAPEKPAEAPKQ